MTELLKAKSHVQVLILFRFVAVLLQFLMVVIAEYALDYSLSTSAMLWVITGELVINSIWFAYYQKNLQASSLGLLIQIVFDIGVLTALLYFSGGATNAFVSILLVPIAFAAVCLTPLMMVVSVVFAMASYSLLLYLMPEHALHHVDMEQHFTGMWVNFLLSALVVAIIVGILSVTVNRKERAIARYREEQLKQEKLLTLGIASAQVTHQLATPIAVIQLLADEIEEQLPEQPAVRDLQEQLKRCSASFEKFRQLALDVKEQKQSKRLCHEVLDELLEQTNLNFPQAIVSLNQQSPQSLGMNILSDTSFMPALLNLIQNAVRASKAAGSDHIEIISELTTQHWQLTIRDFGPGFSSEHINKLGAGPVSSDSGLGLAVYLSHATFERLSVDVSLSNDDKAGARVQLSIPLV